MIDIQMLYIFNAHNLMNLEKCIHLGNHDHNLYLSINISITSKSFLPPLSLLLLVVVVHKRNS